MIKHQTATLSIPNEVPLFIQNWQPESPTRTLFIAHGYGEHSSRYEHVAQFFAEKGCSVCAIDHRAHGRSAQGLMGYFESFPAIVENFHYFMQPQHLPSGWVVGQQYLLGHSMGGLVVLYCMIKYAPPIRAMVTSGAFLDAGRDTSSILVTVVKLLSKVAPKFGVTQLDVNTVCSDPKVVQAYVNDPLVMHGKATAQVATQFVEAGEFVRENLSRITIPVLSLHGALDKLVSPSCTPLIYDRISSTDKQMKLYDGLYHEILNEPSNRAIMEEIWEWLAPR